MTEDDPRHGTLAGYAAGCSCEPCRDARYKWTKRYTAEFNRGKRRTHDATGTIRRIHALQALGWTLPDIARLGAWNSYQAVHRITAQKRVSPKMAARIDAIYQQLCMRIPANTPASKRAKTWAAKHGYAPPLAWDDIDNPYETPRITTSSKSKRVSGRCDEIDLVVVERLLRGERIPSTTVEQEETVLRIMANPGRTLADFAQISHLPVHSIAERLKQRARRAA